jgi:hypothetical protein
VSITQAQYKFDSENKYNQKNGDIMEFKYVIAFKNHKKIYNNYIQEGITLTNGTYAHINITKNTIVKVQIIYKVITSASEKIFIQKEYLLPGNKNLTSAITEDDFYFNYSFNNNSELNSYINKVNSQVFRNPFARINAKVDGDFLKISGRNSGVDVAVFYNLSYNWHTGWTEYYELKWTDGYYDQYFRIERINKDLNFLFTNFTINGLLIIFLCILVYPLGSLWTRYLKESKFQSNVKKESFIQYIKKENKKKHTNRRNNYLESNLKTIEEILLSEKEKI